jgi:fluoroquinolone resistance protein
MQIPFIESQFSDQNFKSLELTHEAIRAKDFDRCKFVGCHFLSCDLTGTNFTDCTFEHCSLSLTKLPNCSLRAITFKDSKLVGIDFTKCSTNFFELLFSNTLLDNCNFSTLPMQNTPFNNCTLRECIFSETNLAKATFANCDFERSVFHDTNLQKTDFSSAKNYTISPLSNSIKGAAFSLPEAIQLLSAFEIELV